MTVAIAEDLARVPQHEAAERWLRFESMGGTVSLRVSLPLDVRLDAERDLRRLAARIGRWAARITRFDAASELRALNRQTASGAVLVGPTLADLLRRSRVMARRTDGLVDVTLLEARLSAEAGTADRPSEHAWWLERRDRRTLVRTVGAVAFDVDGVGKGWIADRALARLQRYPAAMVEADGDVALKVDAASAWAIGIADPHRTADDLAVLSPPRPGRYGIATSGTTVHRWEHASGWSHHLIDPRTGMPADTDVEQVTVVARDALTAESLAKAVVIAGVEAGLDLLHRADAHAAVILLRGGQVIAAEGSEAWLQ